MKIDYSEVPQQITNCLQTAKDKLQQILLYTEDPSESSASAVSKLLVEIEDCQKQLQTIEHKLFFKVKKPEFFQPTDSEEEQRIIARTQTTLAQAIEEISTRLAVAHDAWMKTGYSVGLKNETTHK